MVYRPEAMAARPHRLFALLLLSCTGGEDGSAEGGASIPADGSATMSSGASESPTTATTAPAETTADVPPTTADDTTGDDTTTTGDDTTTASDDSTGPICDPGQPNCVCDDGMCIDGYVCTAGVCAAAMVCDGDLEPPDESEDLPTPLDDITDDDDEFHQIKGVLSGALDVDWYRYHGADTVLHVSEPTIELVSMSAGLRVCQFLECDSGGVALTKLTCPDGTKFAISGDLRPGCCHTTGFTISDFDCDGNDESLQAYIRIDKPDLDECVDYEFKLHF